MRGICAYVHMKDFQTFPHWLSCIHWQHRATCVLTMWCWAVKINRPSIWRNAPESCRGSSVNTSTTRHGCSLLSFTCPPIPSQLARWVSCYHSNCWPMRVNCSHSNADWLILIVRLVVVARLWRHPTERCVGGERVLRHVLGQVFRDAHTIPCPADCCVEILWGALVWLMNVIIKSH